MDERACLLALQKLIVDNQSTLVSGFSHQGVARSIKTVTVSVKVPPTSFYYILIQIRRAEERSSVSGGVNVRHPMSVALYHITLHVADAAWPQSGETNVYETMTLDFRAMCDRIVALIRSQSYFSAASPYDSSRFNLLTATGTDRDVRVINLDHNWADETDENIFSVLYSTIEFTLEEKCQTE